MFQKIALGLVLVGGLAGAATLAAHARPHGPDGVGGHRGQMMQQMMGMTDVDRAAFLDARLAAVKTGLKLTPDQEKLWPAIDTTVRDNAKVMADLFTKAKAAGQPADMIDGINRMADMASARADGLHKLADAAKPLFATLSDEQKGRLPMLVRGGGHGWMK